MQTIKRFKPFLISVAVLVFLVGAGIVFAYTNTYPYTDAEHCGCEVDPWGFYKKQCTSYAAWKANEAGLAFSNTMEGPNEETGIFGNAENWNDNAGDIGFMVETSPRVGAIAVWEAYTGGSGSAGHVAWVEAVNGDNTIDISEYNFNGGDGEYNTRTISSSSPGSYLYLCGVDNVLIEGETISNGNTFNCSAESTIHVKPDTHFESGSDVHLYIE